MDPGQQEFDLVGSVYDAALDPDAWPGGLERIARRMDANSAALEFHDLQRGELIYSKAYRQNARYLESYQRKFVKLNPYLRVLAERPQTVYSSADLLPDTELEGTRFYTEWQAPQEIHHRLGCLLYRDGSRLATVEFRRAKRQGEFDPEARALLRLFEPHFRRAVLINQKFWNLIARSDSASTIFDAMHVGVILIDDRRRPVFISKRAKELTQFGDGLIVAADGLSAPYQAQTEELHALLDAAVKTGLGRGMSPGGAMYVSLLEDRPQQLLISPLRTSRTNLGLPGRRVCAVVFVASPYNPQSISVDSFRTYFGLTEAESKLVHELSNGLTLQEISAKFGVTKHTARAHLRSVLSKTGTRRQAELVNLVHASPAAIIDEQVLLGPALAGPLDRRTKSERRTAKRAEAVRA